MSFIDENDLYIETKYSGIHHLVIMIDGIPLLIWKKKNGTAKYVYMKVSDAIAWHEKELRESKGQSGDADVLKVLRDRQQKFAAEPKQTIETDIS